MHIVLLLRVELEHGALGRSLVCCPRCCSVSCRHNVPNTEFSVYVAQLGVRRSLAGVAADVINAVSLPVNVKRLYHNALVKTIDRSRCCLGSYGSHEHIEPLEHRRGQQSLRVNHVADRTRAAARVTTGLAQPLV